MKFSKRLPIVVLILAIFLLIAFFIYSSKFVAKAQNQIKIFPTAYNIESSGEVTWQNPQNAFTQDLPDNASFSDFNEENSAFIQAKVREETTTTTTILEETTTTIIPEEITTTTTELTTTTTLLFETTTTSESTTTTIPEETTTTIETTTTTTIPSETTTTTLPLEETTTTTILPETTTTTEPISFFKKILGFFIPKVKAEENQIQNSSTSIIFNNFSLLEEFDSTQIQNVQLRFSLGSKGLEGDKIIISYFYNNEWQHLGELNLSNEISNNTNGGYFLYALPVFENQGDLQNLKIKFQVLGSKTQEVYLDSVWLEVDYDEQELDASLIDAAENDYSSSFQVTPKPLFHQKTKLSRKIKINKDSEHSCLVKPFQIILSQGKAKSATILLNKTSESYQEVILGDLPIGIKAYFTNNNDSMISGNNLSNQLSLYLEAEFGSQKGSFNIPIIFRVKDNDFSDTICQFNLIIK